MYIYNVCILVHMYIYNVLCIYMYVDMYRKYVQSVCVHVHVYACIYMYCVMAYTHWQSH